MNAKTIAGIKFAILTVTAILMAAQPASARRPASRAIRPPGYSVGVLPAAAPFVIMQAGDTTWVRVHTSGALCPGDPESGHGGEATGGPDGSRTWCFDSGWPVGDSCGTYPPWDTRCFRHHDVRALSSQTGINYWHLSPYRTDQRTYCGDSCLWCGSDSLWEGSPVECGTWANPPGYGNQWNCIAELDLPGTFDVANGCTLYFDPRYDTECKYDYFYVEFYDGLQWQILGMFNATSNNPGPECDGPAAGSPDHWANTDLNRLANCNWQTRPQPGEPAFKAEIDAASYSFEAGPEFRWRFESDGEWSDAGGEINTDGAAFIDNVQVRGDYERYYMDFESGLDPYWTFPEPDGIIDQWHMTHDPDPPYEGGDGGERTTCTLDSSIVYRARPEGGYQTGAAWRNRWFYRLTTPALPLSNTGCVLQYDQYMCAKEVTCDYTDVKVRFRDYSDGTWCPWLSTDGFVENGGCFFWDFDFTEDVTRYYTSANDSVQFAFDVMDLSQPGSFCTGKHRGTEHLVDNVSVGFFDGKASVFRIRSTDLLHDMFFTDLCAFNSSFHAYDPDTLNHYAGGAHPYPVGRQLIVEVADKDGIQSVELWGTIDGGASWTSVGMAVSEVLDPDNPGFGGDYYGTLCPGDFGLSEWDAGTEVWYYVKCTDQLANEAYFPAEADPGSPDHTALRDDYFEFSILPMYPATFDDPRILLVDGFTRTAFDYSECFADADTRIALRQIYEQTLIDAGYCFDRFDIWGSGASEHVHYLCSWNLDYDAVIWFTGPYYATYLFDAAAQYEMRNYLAGGGKVIICGDRVSYNMAPISEAGAGADSLGGEFLSGIMGCDYIQEMDSPFTKPYVYCEGVSSLDIFWTPTPIDLDTFVIYRGCPYLKDMAWMKTETAPPAGYTAQPFLTVLNPDVPEADMGVYTEYQGVGQTVFLNFDLSASVNHTYQYCSGFPPAGFEGFDPGYYEGRVELLLTILEDIFGLPSSGSGTGGTSGAHGTPAFKWTLNQNSPNPATGSTVICYEVARPGDVSIKVYSAAGRLVKTLVSGRADPGVYTACWEGDNEAGTRVASGVYFYKMEAAGFNAIRKMLILK